MTQQSPHVPPAAQGPAGAPEGTAGQEPELVGVRNFRDVGGLPTVDGRRVAPRVLYRSGHLAGATAADAAFLASLGLHTVFDFRNAADIKLDGPDVELPGVRNINIPLNDPAEGAEFWRMIRHGDLDQLRALLSGGRAAARMTASYRATVTGRTEELGRVVRAVAADSVPALLHCAAGKDRAGVTTAVLLLALGVERDAIEADYLKSDEAHRRYRVRRADGTSGDGEPEVAELMSPLFAARAEYLAAAFESMEETWGSPGKYLSEGLGVDAVTVGRLRERLLTG